MENERLRKLGSEKIKVLKADFDNMYEAYRKKAKDSGYDGELKFVREHGLVVIFVVIE